MPADPRTFPPTNLLLVYEEPPHILAKAANKKDLPGGEPGFKARMISGSTSGLYFYTDPVSGRRIPPDAHKAPCYNNGIVLTNEELVKEKSEGSPVDPMEIAPK